MEQKAGSVMLNDFISREGVKRSLESLLASYKDYGAIVAMNYAIRAVEEAQPAADVAPVKRGRWVEREAQHEDGEETYIVRYTACDQCGMSRSAGLGLANFCPNCGAKMDGGDRK